MKNYQKPLFEVVDVMANVAVAKLLPTESEIVLQGLQTEPNEE